LNKYFTHFCVDLLVLINLFSSSLRPFCCRSSSLSIRPYFVLIADSSSLRPHCRFVLITDSSFIVSSSPLTVVVRHFVITHRRRSSLRHRSSPFVAVRHRSSKQFLIYIYLCVVCVWCLCACACACVVCVFSSFLIDVLQQFIILRILLRFLTSTKR